jgi:hypothetical protein
MTLHPFTLSCALALATTLGLLAATPPAHAVSPDDDVTIDAKAQVASSLGDAKARDRLTGAYELAGGDAVTGSFEGDEQTVTFDLDARSGKRGVRHALRGDVTVETDDAAVTFEDARGRMLLKQNRRGDHVSRLKLKGRHDDGDKFAFRARGNDAD